jgi:hypothetical protein
MIVPPGWGGSLGGAVGGGAVTCDLAATVNEGLLDDFFVVAVVLTPVAAFAVLVVPDAAPDTVVTVPLPTVVVVDPVSAVTSVVDACCFPFDVSPDFLEAPHATSVTPSMRAAAADIVLRAACMNPPLRH